MCLTATTLGNHLVGLCGEQCKLCWSGSVSAHPPFPLFPPPPSLPCLPPRLSMFCGVLSFVPPLAGRRVETEEHRVATLQAVHDITSQLAIQED